MDKEVWSKNSREFAKLLFGFKINNKLSNEDIVKLLIQKASDYQSLCNEDYSRHEYDEPLYIELTNLYDKLTETVLDFMNENPKIIERIKSEKQKQVDDENWVNKDIEPHITFGLTIEDILSKLNGNMYTADLYCGFTVGNKEISIC